MFLVRWLYIFVATSLYIHSLSERVSKSFSSYLPLVFNRHMVSKPRCGFKDKTWGRLSWLSLIRSLKILSPSISTKDLLDHHVDQLTSKFNWRICKNGWTQRNPTDNPSPQMTTVKFDGMNYLTWSGSAILAIQSRRLYRYLIGMQKGLMNNALYDKWIANTASDVLASPLNAAKHKSRIYAVNNSIRNKDPCCSNMLLNRRQCSGVRISQEQTWNKAKRTMSAGLLWWATSYLARDRLLWRFSS